MNATFSMAGDGQFPNSPSYELCICFNGVPGTVVLEINRFDFQGFSGSSESPQTEERRVTRQVCRALLQSSHARAIASAMLSAATEAKQ